MAPVWFQLQWPADWMEMNIAVKELIPIVAATALWEPQWQGTTVRCHCDNMAVVAAINAGRGKYPPINRLLRCFIAQFHCFISAEHIKGSQNVIADAISRNLPFPPNTQVLPSPQPIPPELHQIILEKSLS